MGISSSFIHVIDHHPNALPLMGVIMEEYRFAMDSWGYYLASEG